MSHGEQEIEVKYRIGDAAVLLAALQRAGVTLGSAVRQDDQAYAPATWSYGQPKVGVPFARLRTQTGLDRPLFTVKVPVANELACLEQETQIDDRGAMHEVLLLMGWVPTVRIAKSRRQGAWRGVSVCVDEVDGLGAFLELEAIVAADQDGEVIQAGLDALVQLLGVEAVRVSDTYDSLLQNAARV